MSTTQGSLRVDAFSEVRQGPPCVFVLFGATGDLAARKIAPALYNLAADGLLNDHTAVVGVARRPRTDDVFRQEMLKGLRDHSRQKVRDDVWTAMAARWHYHMTEAGDRDEYRSLAQRLRQIDLDNNCGGSLVFYLATTPETWPDIVDNLARVGLNKPLREGGFVRLVVEKPFGHDLGSARDLDTAISAHFSESQTFRIDHYLGKETVQNILVLRFANAIFEPLLSRNFVESIEITAAETVGMEGRRGAYYENAGALRDMVQNHMLQLLALTTMDAPRSMDADAIRQEKVKILSAIKPLTPEEVARWTVRGQYAADAKGPGYRQEAGVAADSQMETFAALRVFIDTWRWSGVPIYLRTGKRLATKASYVTIQFKREPMDLFDSVECDMGGANMLLLRINPDEGAALITNAKVPGVRMLLRPVRLDFQYRSSFDSASPEAYERLLLDAIAGEATLFIRNDEVEAGWRLVDSIRKAWEVTGEPKMATYPAASWGPPQAEQLFADPYKHWYNLEPR